ncbi:transposase [Gemmata obscuriglobus]|uniref:transposase n=1 Tax=Gemmata obscuriglobus TaxID=114 RepID=UPI0002EF3748|nr:transposase [Gemmata obscuriglobus]
MFLELTVGEYRATCACCKTFRSQIEGIEPRAEYTNRVREAVIDRLLEDGMSAHRLQQALRRDFLLDLSDGFLSDCLDWKVRQTDMPGYRQWTLDNFSGTLCIDELHLGHRTLLLATDPIGDFPVAFAVVSANDQAHMRGFLNNLRNHGFLPQVVVTDGSNLYPTVLADLWPHARHQLCVFHVLKDINTHVFDALRRLRRALARKGGRKRRRGRPSKAQKQARARRGKTKTEQGHFVWKHRHLIVTRPEHLDGRQRRWLSQMFGYLPALRALRAFALRIYRLFDPEQSPHQARCRRAALVRDAQYQSDPDLSSALELLSAEKFDKMMAFLHSPHARRVRTNNHVERTNRRLRYLEKVRYKWRRRRTIVRFIVLALDRWHQQRLTQKQTAVTPDTQSKGVETRKPAS